MEKGERGKQKRECYSVGIGGMKATMTIVVMVVMVLSLIKAKEKKEGFMMTRTKEDSNGVPLGRRLLFTSK